MGIGYKINILLPILFENISVEEKELLDKVNGIRKIRNNVVHAGKLVFQEEATEAVRVAKSISEMMKM